MKAYVIKNKEGKYWQVFYNDESEFVDEIYNGFMHYSEASAQKSIDEWELKDCEVIEITIAEGDLEEENKVLKKALELACETIRQMLGRPAYICGGALADKLGIPMMPEPKDYDYFIELAKENKYE